jgi:prolyl-tRNA synthetase
MKGVPVRLELGPKDMKNEEVRVVIRYNNKKYQVKQNNLLNEVEYIIIIINNR